MAPSVPIRKSTWLRQAAVVISDSANLPMLLRELVRSHGWTISEATPSAVQAVEALHSGSANMVIIDDTASLPALPQARYLLSDPIALCSPVLCFLLPAHEPETQAMTKLGGAVIDKPLTPSKFLPVFTNTIRKWDREPYLSLRRASYMYLDGQEPQALMKFAKLMQEPTIQHICGQAIALNLRRSGKLKEAEQVLLTALKRSPRELSVVLALADLYMHSAMPKLAHRLLLSARSAYSNSLAMIPDLIQAAIMLGQLDDALQSLNLVVKAGNVDEKTLGFLGRLLFSEGREQEAERLLVSHGAPFKKLQAAWAATDSAPAAPAAAS